MQVNAIDQSFLAPPKRLFRARGASRTGVIFPDVSLQDVGRDAVGDADGGLAHRVPGRIRVTARWFPRGRDRAAFQSSAILRPKRVLSRRTNALRGPRRDSGPAAGRASARTRPCVRRRRRVCRTHAGSPSQPHIAGSDRPWVNRAFGQLVGLMSGRWRRSSYPGSGLMVSFGQSEGRAQPIRHQTASDRDQFSGGWSPRRSLECRPARFELSALTQRKTELK